MTAEYIKKISCLVFDVDGTLTDGHIYMGTEGELFKAFDSKDGLAIKLAGQLGYKTALITGRQSQIVENRARELAINAVYQGVVDKTQALKDLCRQFSVEAENIAYMGDDLNDLSALLWVGLPCAPVNACEEIKNAAKFVSARKGGRGAVREMIEFILKTQDKWPEGIRLFLKTK
jgi:3-deoxy-D-manno-octulosonate 8-phosphate phosphatase (KDO 8-P phosphatase)